MEIALAKEFIYKPFTFSGSKTIYVSKSLDTIMNIDEDSKELYNVYAVLDTPNGEKLFETDFTYSGTPIVMRVFIHKEFYVKAMTAEGYKFVNI